jgi:hypothetical protein
MNHFPESDLPPSEVFSLARARIGNALDAAMLAGNPSRSSAAQSEPGGPEQDDDGPETWTGLPV